MKIGILGSRGYPSTYGGFETFVRRLAPWLHGRGHSVTVYAHERSLRDERVWTVDGVRIIATPGLTSKSAATVSHGFTGALHALRERYDVILALNIANGFALPMLRAARIPVIVNVDGIEWERAKWGRSARLAFRAGAKMTAIFADRLVADAEAIRERWAKDYGVHAVFIPYGADIASAGADRVIEAGLTPGTYALAVARLAPENNVEVFLDALERLDWTVPSAVVGSANYSNELEGRLRRLHEEGRVIWFGHVADQELLLQLWGNSAVYFHGHTVGGTNPALLQALGAGAPTIAADTIYNREVLRCGRQLVTPVPEAVATALSRVLGDEQERHQMSERGRATIRDRYQWEAVCLQYEDLLTSVAPQRFTGC